MLVYLLSMLDDESDKTILEKMYIRYKDKALHVTMRVLQNAYDAEDAAIDGWVNVVQKFDDAKKYYFDSDSHFESWLTIVMKNAARDARRKRKTIPEPIDIFGVPSSADTETEGESNMILEFIGSLPDEVCSILEKHLVLGYRFDEIGKLMGCSKGAAQKRYSRAVKMLREKMGADT